MLGYASLLAFLALIGVTFWTNRRTRRLLKDMSATTSFISHVAWGLDGR